MSPSAVPDRSEGSGSSYAVLPAPKRLMSPGAYVLLGILMAVSAFIVFKVTAAFQDAGAGKGEADAYEEIDIGTVSRDLSPEGGGLMRDPFLIRIALVLNPKRRDLGAVRAQVERRRNLLRDIVWSEIVNPKSDAELRRPGVFETLKFEIRQRLNIELDGSKEGPETISRVVFLERKQPERR